MKTSIWMSYDLGVRGDYEGLFTWLDEHHAIECGDNLAFLQFDFSSTLLESIQASIRDAVKITRKSRIYMIWRDEHSNKMKGRFIIGSRKVPPWTGYAVGNEDIEEEEIEEIEMI